MKKFLVGLLLLAVLAIPVVGGSIHIDSGNPYDCFMILK